MSGGEMAKGERLKAKGQSERVMSKGGPKFKEFRVEFCKRVKTFLFTSIE
jgi:hypothetical protein